MTSSNGRVSLLWTVCLLALLTPGIGSTVEAEEVEQSVLMRAEDGNLYIVQAGETLAAAMQRKGALVRAATHVLAQEEAEKEKGNCVPEPLEDKPEGAVACKCYEITKCKGNESPTCKRHCKKDLCMCCTI